MNKRELFLILKKEFFLEILKGTKKTEYRSFSQFYKDRLLILDRAGEIDGMKEYDTIRFALGYSKDRPEMVVECAGIYIGYDDPEAEFLTEENCEFEIDLGEIIETKNCESLI